MGGDHRPAVKASVLGCRFEYDPGSTLNRLVGGVVVQRLQACPSRRSVRSPGPGDAPITHCG
jgi:hypothetical protein